MNDYLIEGLSGTGKTTVGEELSRRGFRVLDADKAFGFYGDPETGLPSETRSQLNWLWDKVKLEQELKDSKEITFVCGGAMNQEDFKDYFTKIFTLYVDDETLKHRLLNRTNNDFGKEAEDLARQLEWNKGTLIWAKERGTTPIDASKPLETVVDKILSYVNK